MGEVFAGIEKEHTHTECWRGSTGPSLGNLPVLSWLLWSGCSDWRKRDSKMNWCYITTCVPTRESERSHHQQTIMGIYLTALSNPRKGLRGKCKCCVTHYEDLSKIFITVFPEVVMSALSQ